MGKLPGGMVALPEAARMACFEAGVSGAISDAALNEIAHRLAQLLTVYSVAEGTPAAARAVAAEEMQGGVFIGGARSITFNDGRPSVSGLAVTASALRAVLKLFRPGARGP